MKWYFALSAASVDSPPHDWRALIRVAVHTALQNTTLRPHLIWDGPEHPFLQELRERGVNVIFHRVAFYRELEAYRNDAVFLATASGCFLRVEIPVLEQTDDFVLYTDADVMFQRDPVPLLEGFKPHHFAAAPEFTPDDNLNSGVLLLNVRQLRADYPGFTAFIRGNLNLGLDQDMYRNYYAGYHQPLDPGCNWKPYWGVREDACILHWHGIKPADARKYMADETYGVPAELAALIQRDRGAYRHYLDVFQSQLDGYGAQVNNPGQMPETCAIVLVVKDEAHDIAAWLAWYHLLGVDACIVYDDHSTDGTWEILTAAAAVQDIRLHRTVGPPGGYEARQDECFRAALAADGAQFDWLGFFDADEFLFLPEDESVKTFLRRFAAVDAVAVNWCVYGSAGHILKPPAPPPEAFTRHGSVAETINRYVKSFVRPARLRGGWINVHCFDADPARYVLSNGAPVRWSETPGIIDADPDWGCAKLMHFQNRSMEHFVARIKKRPELADRPGIWQAGDLNQHQDVRPLAAAAALRAQLARLAVRALDFHPVKGGVQADLGEITTIRQLRLTADPAFSRLHVILSVSIDGAGWVEIFAGLADSPVIWDGPGAAWARYVRVLAPAAGTATLRGVFS